MLARDSSFDVVLRDETISETHAANHLIAHKPRFNGTKLTFDDHLPLLELQHRGFVLFHGRNDGSLHDQMIWLLSGSTQPLKPRDYTGHFVRRFKIEDIELPFDESESRWQAEAMRCHSRGQDIIPYSECRKKVPSVHKQNKWESGQLDLPITKSLVHFNAGLCRDGDGRLWTVVRQWTEETETWWNSRMLACQLDDRMNIIRKAMLTPRGWQEEQHEIQGLFGMMADFTSVIAFGLEALHLNLGRNFQHLILIGNGRAKFSRNTVLTSGQMGMDAKRTGFGSITTAHGILFTSFPLILLFRSGKATR